MVENNTALARRIDAMEVKLTWLEQASEEMSTIITAQQTSIETLHWQLEQTKARMRHPGAPVYADDAPPPHY